MQRRSQIILAFAACLLPLALPATAASGNEKETAGALKTGVLMNSTTRNSAASKQSLTLAARGAARLPIVVSVKAGDRSKTLAKELKHYLDRITGADFSIETGDATRGIVVGTMEEFTLPELKDALQIAHSFDGKESYAIRTQPGRLLLIGATDKGVSHVVFRLLAELGCRWFFPSDAWQVIPKSADLQFARDITDRPDFLSRSIWYAWGNFDDDMHPQGDPELRRSAPADHAAWLRHNCMAESFVVNAGHSYEGIAGQFADEFAKHPEYWALVQGKRQGPQFELSNPALRKLIVDWAIDHFKKNPQADMISVDPADGAGTSESDESKRLGTPGEIAFGLANEVARAIEREFPGQNKMVGLYAYNWHSDPPPFELEPNVYIQLTMAFNGGNLTLDELFEQWPKKARNLGFYDYYSTWRWDYDLWPGGRVSNKNYVVDSIRRFQKTNAVSGAFATSISAESSNNWGVNGRGYYLASRLMWNPQHDPAAILQDFYDKAFGPAAAAMQRYYELQDSLPPISPGVVGTLFRTLAEARSAAKDRADVMRRLDDLANYLHYYDLNYRNAHESADGKNDSRQLEIWTLAYRNRYAYMTHWEAIRQDSIHEPANPNAPKPWKVDRPITRDETEAWFQNGLRHYPELQLPAEIAFGSELLPVDFGGPMLESDHYYQEGSSYSVYTSGKPIHFKIDAGSAYGGLRQVYRITDSAGKVHKEGKPQPDEKIEFDWQPPSAGVYSFEYHDHGAYGTVHWQKDQIVALPLRNRELRAMKRIAPMFFYVPIGTKQIDYYYKQAPWQFGGPHELIGPAGQVVKQVAINGDYVSAPVPEGADGKVWSIGGPSFGLGEFRFFNIPNYFSPSPGKMLLPRDVVERDRLKIVEQQ